MSDTMLFGVLRMPPDLWRDDEIDKAQRHARYVEAADRIVGLEARLATAAGIIEAADHRALAVDGPVGHCRDEMTNAEWRQLYLAVKGGKQTMSDDIRKIAKAMGQEADDRIAALQARIAELEVENEKWKFELDDYDQYTMCDCCEALHTGCVDAEGHMQCPSCCRIAELEAEVERLKAIYTAGMVDPPPITGASR